MTDTLSPEQRSALMSRIRGKDTSPEMAVRRLVHGLGYRYRLHRRDLPGTPDLVFGPRRKVIFVHGCFWHLHEGCDYARMPKSRREYWAAKLEGNRQRDERNQRELERLGWQVLVIWECEIKKGAPLAPRIEEFLGSRRGDARGARPHPQQSNIPADPRFSASPQPGSPLASLPRTQSQSQGV